jgi:hypothetical protein
MSKEKTSTKIVNTIPLKTARKWAKRWAKVEGDYNKHHHLKGFLIPKADLIQVLAEGVDAVRAYIGVDDEHCEKLMIVGTKLNTVSGVYEDMITVGVGNVPNLQNDIYDFTSPCPPACDTNSPLNQ